MWCDVWAEPHLLWLHWWFLTLCHLFEQAFFSWRWMNLKVGSDISFFPHWGGIIWSHKLAHINNPWFLWVIFIGLFIIKFIVINVQIGRVCKHGNTTFMIRSIPCPTILNDIFFSEIGTCKKNGSLMFTQVSIQRPFTCATNILGERKWDLICHIRMLLALYNPCMASFFLIIYPMGDIGVKDQCGLFNARFHNVFHNLIFYELVFLHLNCVHVMSCNRCHEFPHYPITLSTSKPFCF